MHSNRFNSWSLNMMISNLVIYRCKVGARLGQNAGQGRGEVGARSGRGWSKVGATSKVGAGKIGAKRMGNGRAQISGQPRSKMLGKVGAMSWSKARLGQNVGQGQSENQGRANLYSR